MFRSIFVSLCLLLALLVLASCAGNKTLPAAGRGSLERIATIPANRLYSKAVSDPRGSTVYALSRESQEIDIYLDGARVNSIGGLGFERTNFQRLSDIGVDTDGGLLALDTAQKLLRKFSSEGMPVSEISFASLAQPELFCVAPDGTLFIYDAAPAEIICYSPLDAREMYRFGRFELDRPVNLDCNRDFIWAHNREKQTTHIFYLLGQHQATLKEIVAVDRQGSYLEYYTLHYKDSRESTPPLSLTLRGDLATVLWDNEIWLERLVYERSEVETQ